MTRKTVAMTLKDVHADATKRPIGHWLIGVGFLAYAVYRVESHTHADGDRVEHLITATAFLFGCAVTPYVKESVIAFVRGLAPYVPFVGRKNGNDTLSGRGGP